MQVDEGDRERKPFEALQADQAGHHQIEDVVVTKCLEDKGTSDYWEILSIGVPTDEKSFLRKAFKAGHLRTMAIHLSDGVKEVLKRNFSGEQYALMKKRLAYIHRSGQTVQKNLRIRKEHYTIACLKISRAYYVVRGCC